MHTSGRRQLVLCFDGTNNNLTGGLADTNVVKLCEALQPEPGRQLVYYDPGVGNAGTLPGVTLPDKLRGWSRRLWGLALGKGVYENMAEAYLFLMRHWEPGDEIWVFGFSRGAFTARSVAGMVARFGILQPAMECLVPTLVHLFFSQATMGDTEYSASVQQVRESFCSPEGAQARVWFVGVWDTVESVGAALFSQKINGPSSIVGSRFQHVRQALALDEHRRAFEPRPYYIKPGYDYAAAGQSIRQFWWSGAHCDVGGGYKASQAELSDRCLRWMLREAADLGLRLKPGALDSTVAKDRPPVVHSETFTNAYWALTGLAVRDFSRARGAPGDPPALPPQQWPLQDGEPPLRMPHDTAWARRTQPLLGLLALVLAALFWVANGSAITGQWPWQYDGLAAGLRAIADANAAVAWWQLGWLLNGWGTAGLRPQVAHPVWMLAADLGLILSYGYLLALGLARGFANWAGLSTVDRRPPRLLNLLGWSGTVIVLADVAEDLLMLLVLAAGWLQWTWLENALAVAMSLASAAKWLGLLPAAVLVARCVR